MNYYVITTIFFFFTTYFFALISFRFSSQLTANEIADNAMKELLKQTAIQYNHSSHMENVNQRIDAGYMN